MSKFEPIEIKDKVGFGTMSMTWVNDMPPMEQSIKTLEYVTSPRGLNVKFLNGATFYGADDANLKLLKKFFEGITPDLSSQLILSIKGGLNLETFTSSGSRETVNQDIQKILSYFPKGENRPKILYQTGRVDPKTPYEDTISSIAENVNSGLIDGISISEVGSQSIIKASKVSPISCVELEFSIMTQDILENGILKTASDLGIPVIAYSPVAKGFLTDFAVENLDKFSARVGGDMRSHFDRFNSENFSKNMELVRALYKFAHEVKKTSLESLALSWILAISERKDYAGIKKVSKIISIPSGSTQERIKRNFTNHVELSAGDLKEIDQIVKNHKVAGGRYSEALRTLING